MRVLGTTTAILLLAGCMTGGTSGPSGRAALVSLAAADVQRAIAAAEQLPMMAPRRVVRVTDFGKLREDQEAALLRYLARPAETAVVVFLADDLDKRRKLSKTLIESCVSVEFAAMTDENLRLLARQIQARSVGGRFDIDRRLDGERRGKTIAVRLVAKDRRRVVEDEHDLGLVRGLDGAHGWRQAPAEQQGTDGHDEESAH